jgi:hypothetical protein
LATGSSIEALLSGWPRGCRGDGDDHPDGPIHPSPSPAGQRSSVTAGTIEAS